MGLLDLVVWTFIFLVILNELTIQERNLSSDPTFESYFHPYPLFQLQTLLSS
jgi:hypothetical protein